MSTWRTAGLRLRAGGMRVLVAPAAGCGLLGLVLVGLPGRHVVPIGSRLELVTLLLAAATTPALVEPAGSVADATPTGRVLRRATRLAVAAASAATALVLVRLAASASPGGGFVPLAMHVALAAAVAAVVSRHQPEGVAAAGAASVVALAGAGPRLAGMAQWSLDAPTAGTGRLTAVAVLGALAFLVASHDPGAHPRAGGRR